MNTQDGQLGNIYAGKPEKNLSQYKPEDMNNTDKQKFRISIIDFMPEYMKHEVGIDKNGVKVHFGDMVEYNGEKNWFVSYRYGDVMLKQVGMMAMIGSTKYKDGDFSNVERLNVFGAGTDWLIIGYTDDPIYEKLKHVKNIDLP